jgi:hypothetical protein
MRYYCILSFGRTGSTLLVNLFYNFAQDFNTFSEIINNINFKENENISKILQEYILERCEGKKNILFKYIFSGDKKKDNFIIRELNKLNCTFLYLERNYIDSHISDKIAKKNNTYSNFNTSLKKIDLDISEIYDCINSRTEMYNFINNNIPKIHYIRYEAVFKNKTILVMIQELNKIFNNINNTDNVIYLKYEENKKIIEKQNNFENNMYNIKSITNKTIKPTETIETIETTIICKNLRIFDYYKQNINLDIDYSATLNIINVEYYLKINSGIKKYLKNKNYIFLYDNEIILTIFCEKNSEIEIIKDNNLFVKFSDYNFENNLNNIYHTYSKNIILLKHNLKPIINFIDDAFIIHLDDDMTRNMYVKNIDNYFKHFYFVKAISYKDDENVYNLCNYLLYRKYYNDDLYKLNYYHSFTFGAICIAISNIIILKFCKQNSINKLMVFEDDVILNKNMYDITDSYLSLPNTTDISYWGIKQDFRKELNFINDKWYKKNDFSWGCHSYLIHNLKAINKLLNYYSSFNTCIDCYDFVDLNCYVSKKNFFITDETNLDSNIKNSLNDNTNENNWKYNLSEYDYVKKYNFVIFNDIDKNNNSTWNTFVKSLNVNTDENLKINYKTKNINKNTLVFFDFVDREFGWDFYKFKSMYPDGVSFKWGGIIHHPFYLQEYWGNNLCVNDYLQIEYVKMSLKNCKFLIVLSNQLKNEIINSGILKDFQIDIYVLYHIMPTQKFMYTLNQPKYLTFIGWSFRNYTLFLNTKCSLKKIIKPGTTNDEQNGRFNKILNIHNTNNVDISDIEIKKYTTYEEFLDIFKNSVCFIDFDGVSANNAILECIAYNIPILVPNLEATRFYLGENYPLYFNDEADINIKINDMNIIMSAVAYLKNMDKVKFTLSYNIFNTLDIIETYI